MKRYFVIKDGNIQASTATKESALDLVRAYQQRETHPFLKANFSIVYGEEEYVPYETKPRSRARTAKAREATA